MNHHDMRLQQPRCQPSTPVTSATHMQDRDDIFYHGKYSFDNRPRTSYNSATRKEKANSIFSFLQRFRTKNKNVVEDVSSLPSSPRISHRFAEGPNTCRWESVESVLSSATATSFAFIPPHQCRSVQKPRYPSNSNVQRPSQYQSKSSSNYSLLVRDNSAFLRQKYNLLGSDATLCRNTDDPKESKKLKKLYRNSVGNVENLKRDWSVREFASFQRPSKPQQELLNRRPKSEYNVSGTLGRKPQCYKPGKRRAPPPPIKIQPHCSPKTHAVARPAVLHSRKKRKAPSPPRICRNMETPKDGGAAVGDKEEYAMCNDSLKLEKGMLKANKMSTLTATTSGTSIPVSPKPWYKRSATRNHHSKSIKSLDKKKTCEQLLDEWMLEAGLPRPSAFHEEQRKVMVSSSQTTADKSGKRKSQLSMLANISELDREAAEIVKKERNREQDASNSINGKFYEHSTFEEYRSNHCDAYRSNFDEPTTSKRHTSKDLISILNAITNVTKITVNTSFFKDHSGRVVAKQVTQEDAKCGQANKAPEVERKSKLTITEVEDFEDGNATKEEKSEEPNSTKVLPEMKTEIENMIKEPVKPVKPFSSWMCPQCTLENPSWKFICETCNKWRPYSVNKSSSKTTTAIAVTPKEDVKLKFDNVFNRESTTLAEEREIDNISKNIRKQVYDILTSGEGMKNLSKIQLSNKERLDAMAAQAETNCEPPSEKSAIEKIGENIEEIRKARLAFFNKNSLNDLNISKDSGTSYVSSNSKPMNVNRTDKQKNKYYNEEDRRKLREILKELKNSLPNSNFACDRTSNDNISNLETNSRTEPNVSIPKGAERTDNNESESKNTRTNNEEKAEAYFITTKTIFENVTPQQKITKNDDNINDAKTDIDVEIKIPVNTYEIKNDSVRTSVREEIKNIKPPEKEETKMPAVDIQNETNEFSKQFFVQKNGVLNTKENKCVTNLAVNRLLKKLQTAIASGQHHEAANIARELARLKVNCNMTRQDITDNMFPFTFEQLPLISLNVRVKDKTMHREPFLIKISPSSMINELQSKISKEYDIPVQNQRLMYGRRLIINDVVTLDQLGINTSGSTIFLHITPSPENENLSVNFVDKSRMAENDIKNRLLEKPLNVEFDEFVKNENTNLKNAQVKNDVGVVSAQDEIVATVGESSKSIIENVKEKEVNIDPEQKSTVRCAETIHVNLTAKQLQSDVEKLDNIADWECPRCTLINKYFARNCIVCGRPRNENKITVKNKDESLHGLNSSIEPKSPEPKLSNYQELVDLEKTDLITNVQQFDCPICLSPFQCGEGVILKECLHTFCRQCLSQTIEYNDEAEVKCPFRDTDYSCESVLQEREIKSLVSPLIFEKHLARSVSEAENKIENAFHCKTADCRGWCIFEDNVNEFHCPVCSKINCLTCQIIHTGLNCKQYQEVINKESETNADANRTRLMLQEMLQKGEAMTCPTCQVILMKKWGCDWLRCSMCKMEICWVTRGPRWGPKGKGDTSGGCRCGVNGVKCHQRCTFCH